MQNRHQAFWAIILSNIAMMLVVLAVHFWSGNNSMLNLNSWDYLNPEKELNEAYLADVVEYHQVEPSFSRRVVTTQSILATHKITGISIGGCFVGFNYIVLLLCALVITYTSLTALQNLRLALLSGLLFWFSFPVLFAFFPAIYSYDDPLLYLFITLTVFFLIKKKTGFAALTFATAILIRESALIVLPGIILFISGSFKFKQILKSISRWMPFALIAAVFSMALILWQYVVADASFTQDATKRFSVFAFNFQNKQFAIETIISLLMVVQLPLMLFRDSKQFNSGRIAFMATLIINTVIVLLFTQARESRLFMLPLFFWFPFAGHLLLQKLNDIHMLLVYNKWLKSTLLILFAVLIGFTGYSIYQPTAMNPHENWHQEYLFLLLTFTALMPYATPPPIKKE